MTMHPAAVIRWLAAFVALVATLAVLAALPALVHAADGGVAEVVAPGAAAPAPTPPDPALLAADPLAALLSGGTGALGGAAAAIYLLVALARNGLRVGGRHLAVPFVTAWFGRLPPVATFALVTLGPAIAATVAAIAVGQPFGAALSAGFAGLLAGGAATGINDAARHGKAYRAQRRAAREMYAATDTAAPPAGMETEVDDGDAAGPSEGAP